MSELEAESPIKPSPFRFRTSFEVLSKMGLGKVNVEGLENIDKLPKNRPIVVVPTHITDLDALVAMGELVKYLKLSLTHLSTSQKADPVTHGFRKLLGESNFIPIDYVPAEGERKWSSFFNLANFTPMLDALKKNKAILIVGHNPTYNHVLPDKGNMGSIFLAQKAHAVILPVAINIHVKKEDIGKANAASFVPLLTKYPRATADLTIGSPLELPPLNVDLWQQIIQERSARSPEEKDKFTAISKGLREQSDILMQHLAAMLPPDKRGRWAKI